MFKVSTTVLELACFVSDWPSWGDELSITGQNKFHRQGIVTNEGDTPDGLRGLEGTNSPFAPLSIGVSRKTLLDEESFEGLGR